MVDPEAVRRRLRQIDRRVRQAREVAAQGDPAQVWDHLARLDVLERFALAVDRRLAGS